MSGYTTDYALDEIINKLPIIFLLIYRGNIAPFIQRTEGALQTLAFKKQLHLKIWILAVKSLWQFSGSWQKANLFLTMLEAQRESWFTFTI